jgi:hypothetical protein
MATAKIEETKLKALIVGELDPERFSHRDHILVAYAALEQNDFFKACHLLADGLRNLAAQAGVPEKFNATITLASICTVAERMEKGSYSSADDFILANQDLLKSAVLTASYSKERLGGEMSRKIGLLP